MNEFRAAQYKVIEDFAKAQTGPVQMYDFGLGVTTMPVPDFKGSFLTRSICVLYVKKDGKVPEAIPDEALGKIFVTPEGWMFYSVQFGLDTTPEQIQKDLDLAKEKLLEASNGNK